MKSCTHRLYGTAIYAALAGQLMLPSTGLAQTAATEAAKQQTGSAPPPTDTPAPAKQNFGGLSLGVGLGLTLNADKVSRVTSASAVNGIVRVTGTSDAVAGIVLESHYFFVPNRDFATVPQGAWGHGPFVAIVAGSSGSNVISAYALGWMIGLREPTWTYVNNSWKATYGSSSWNFGVGVRIDPSVQVLGDGDVANMPLPAGETAVRFKNVPSYGVIMVSSFSF
jgi:hypothetical protein